MAGTGGRAQSPGRSEEARRRRRAIGLFIAATFGMLAILSLPVSKVAKLPFQLPRPLQRGLGPLGPLLRPSPGRVHVRHPAPRKPASPLIPVVQVPPGVVTGGVTVGPLPGRTPRAPSPAEVVEAVRPGPDNLFFPGIFGVAARTAASRARIEGVEGHARLEKGQVTHRGNRRPRGEHGGGAKRRQHDHHPPRHRHGPDF